MWANTDNATSRTDRPELGAQRIVAQYPRQAPAQRQARRRQSRAGSTAVPSSRRFSWVVALLALTLGCGPYHFISAYDEVIDSATSALHTELSAFVAKMESVAGKPEGMYEHNAPFYTEVNARVSTLQMRAGIQEKNQITLQQFDELGRSLGKLEQLHQSNGAAGLPGKLGKPALAGISSICSSIIRLEVAKREWRDQ